MVREIFDVPPSVEACVWDCIHKEWLLGMTAVGSDLWKGF